MFIHFFKLSPCRILATIENKEIEQSCLKLDKNDKDKKKRPCCPS